jgi:hypothetical protein
LAGQSLAPLFQTHVQAPELAQTTNKVRIEPA